MTKIMFDLVEFERFLEDLETFDYGGDCASWESEKITYKVTEEGRIISERLLKMYSGDDVLQTPYDAWCKGEIVE